MTITLTRISLVVAFRLWLITAQGASISEGLVLHLPFNGTTQDTTGSGYDAILNSVPYGPDRFGNSNGAVVFHGGSTDFVRIESSETVRPSSYTISLWFKASTVDGNPRFLIAKAGAEFEIHLGEGGSRLTGLRFLIIPGAAIDTPLNVFAAGSWFHIACVAGEGSGGQKVYINGIDVGGSILGNIISSAMQLSAEPIMIGKRSGDGPQYRFLGSIDELRIYDRVLSPEEVLMLYQHEAENCVAPVGAKATAQIVNGFVVGATVTIPGCGYSNPPLILIQGGGGSGATATATVSDGRVTAISITSAGCCYTNAPTILIASPGAPPRLAIAASLVQVTQRVVLGRKYLLESSFDGVAWTAAGPPFVATAETITQEFDAEVAGTLFRLREVP